ncbi:AAA family ATPase [Paracoccus pantotrophus]|uniref:AAA family ATPase n=1 Tax=Paracoccus pantotrophus TaxID=82367 RepID=UPI000F4224A3|nr:AAA family ATPase [Paracoccus pantotrophus]RNI20619.1 hypothetical protein EB844_00920 [Paracoccus pantotrophus]
MLGAVAELREAIAALPEPPILVVLDTLARNFGGGDENSTKDMSAFIAAADSLKADHADCAVLIVHHSGHAEKQRARGAMALKGALDVEYRLEGSNSGLVLTNTKMKDEEPPKPLRMTLQPTGGSAVLVEADTPAGGLTAPQQMAKEALIQTALEMQHPGDDSIIPTEGWRRHFYQAMGDDKSQDAKKKAFRRASEQLEQKGFVAKDGDGYRLAQQLQMEIRLPRLHKTLKAV